MKRLAKWLLGLIMVPAFLLVLFVAHSLYAAKPLHIRIFYERTFLSFALDSPQLLSSLRILPSWLDWYSDDLNDYSLAKAEEGERLLVEGLDGLHQYDREALDDKLSYDILEFFLKNQVDGLDYRFHNFPLNQLFGMQSNLPTFMVTQHPVASVKDAENYNSRLSQFPRVVRESMEGLEKRQKLGIIPPTFVVEKVLAEMRDFVAKPASENILYSSLEEKLEKAADSIDSESAAEILDVTKSRIEDDVYPAYAIWIKHYEDLLPLTTGNNGAWSLPDGDAYYRYEVRNHTTTDLTPDQVHQIGLEEVARIEQQMDAILRGDGLLEGTIGERVQIISKRPDQLYADSDEGREQILKDYQSILDEIDKGIDAQFDVRPKIGMKVERIPVFKEKTAPGAYYQTPAFDGSRPGIFYINLRSVSENPRFAMRTLAYHEGIPGHHFQSTIQQELTGVPMFRKMLGFTAFSEGWALYSERVAAEAGFQPTPLDDLGRLQAEMFRAVRLVVDTGLHHKRWNREQAIAYMLEKTGMGETDVTAEIERYIVNPGQALAYKVGMNTLLELRAKAQVELGKKFDIRRFHNMVLTSGDLPLSILRTQVDDWIAAEKMRTNG